MGKPPPKKPAPPTPRKPAPKQSTPPISTLASNVLAGRVKPTQDEINALAASVLSQDQTPGQKAR